MIMHLLAIVENSFDSVTPRCINTKIEIDKGQKVVWSINVKDRMVVDRNAFLRFIGSLFAVEPLSRLTVSLGSDEPVLDQTIIQQELLKQVTFVSAKNIDEQEVALSAIEIREFLVSKGYVNAEVVPNLVLEDTSNMVVNFDVYAGTPYVIRSVRLLPDQYLRYVTKEEIESLVRVRSIGDNGHLSYEEIKSASTQIERKLLSKGFSDIAVSTDIISTDVGGVEVVFYVSGKPREIVEEIIIENSQKNLNREIVPLLSNCDHFKQDRKKGKKSVLCRGSSFIPSKLEEDVNRLTEYYRSNGFLYVKVASSVSKSDKGYKITFTVFDSRLGESSKQPPVRQDIKDVIITGNESTNANVIKRLFPRDRKNGDLDPLSLKKGLANLRESGGFSRIDHKVLFTKEGSDDAYFMLQVAERPSLSFDVAIAFSTDQLFLLEAEVEETNLFSSLLKLNTSLGLGLFWGRQSIFKNEFSWPAIWGKPLKLTVQAPMVVYDDRTHWHDNKTRRLRSKVSFSFDWRLTSRITPYLRYWLQLNQVEEFKADNVPRPTFNDRLVTLDGLIPTMKQEGNIRGVLKPGISYVFLDDPLEPHQGVDLNLWSELSGGPLFGNPSFVI